MSLSRSDVWNYFTKSTPTECVCILCDKIYRTGGGTSNMRNHLKCKHGLFVNSCGETGQTIPESETVYLPIDICTEANVCLKEEVFCKKQTVLPKKPRRIRNPLKNMYSVKPSASTNVDEDHFIKYILNRIGQTKNNAQKVYAESLIIEVLNKALLNQLTQETCIK